MSDLRPKHIPLEIGGRQLGLLFDLNAIDEIQDHFDLPISQLTDLLADERKVFKVLRFLLTVLINEAVEDSEDGEKVSERWVGRKISASDIPILKGKIYEAFTASMPIPDDENPTKSGR